jgi:transcriptional regulator
MSHSQSMVREPSAGEPILHVGPRFRVDDRVQAFEWLTAHNLGMLITAGADGWPRASASPLILRPGDGDEPRVYAHLDGRNPQVAHLREGRPLLYSTRGPRAYVSPAWFPRRPAAPTYLHITVQLRGRASMLDDEGTAWLLLETVKAFEGRGSEPWDYDGGERFLANSARAVAGFEILVEGIDAACKLNQNRSSEERELIAARLGASERSDDRAIAALLRATDPEQE